MAYPKLKLSAISSTHDATPSLSYTNSLGCLTNSFHFTPLLPASPKPNHSPVKPYTSNSAKSSLPLSSS